MGEGELLSACELLGGRTLRISRDTGCDLLTREVSSGAASLLTDNCPTVSWFHPSPSRPKLQRIQTSSPPNSQLSPNFKLNTRSRTQNHGPTHIVPPSSFPLLLSPLPLLSVSSTPPPVFRTAHAILSTSLFFAEGAGSRGAEEGSLLSLSPVPFPEI